MWSNVGMGEGSFIWNGREMCGIEMQAHRSFIQLDVCTEASLGALPLAALAGSMSVQCGLL